MGLLIGRDRKTGKLMRYPGLAHLLTIALTRSGKGVGIIPNLLKYPFGVVCIDSIFLVLPPDRLDTYA